MATDETAGSKILVVDDTQDNLDLMVEVLEEGPWTVATARDASGALERTSEERFDLFLLDVQMPDIDGFELCRRLRRAPDTQHVPVIFVTAKRTSTASVIEGLDVGGFDYITKPFDQAELLARVRVMLRLRAAEKRLLAVQGALDEQNQRLSTVNDKLAEACQQMLEQRVELAHKTHQLERANKVKSEFLAKMSHELRTPLNSIIGFSDLMMSDKKEPPAERQTKRLEKIGRNGRQLLALINDILDLSKIEADHMTLMLAPVDVTAVARECIDLARPLLEEKPVKLEARVPGEMHTWEGDEVRLRQVITNLLSNAIKFTDSGSVTLEVWGSDDGVHIAVSDTGIGIAPEHLPLVFDPFRQVDSSSTRRAGGTGLGLPICRKLCSLMGGTIEARSELGAGSTFEVTLPWRAEQRKLNDESKEENDSRPPQSFVLLCSEDAGMVDLTATRLAVHGIDVRHAESAGPARDLLRQERPEGVIIDIKVSEVFALLRLVKSVDPPIPCMWLSAWTEDHQLGCIVQLDDYMIGSGDATVAVVDTSALISPDKTVLAYAGSDAACQELRAALSDLGYEDIRAALGADEAINELSSGKVGDLFVDLAGLAPDALHLVNRVRQAPEWASVRIIGVVPARDGIGEQEAGLRTSDEFVQRHGVATPTLLLDIAEKLIATHTAVIAGACV